MIRGVVWRTLLQERASYSQTFFSVTEGYLLNNFLPFRLGEVGRAYLLSQKAKLDFWSVFSTIFIERALDLALAVGLPEVGLPAWILGVQIAAGVFLPLLAGLFTLARHARLEADL